MDFEIEFDKINNKNAEIIDIRSPSSFEFGHITNAINIPTDELLQKELSPKKTYYIYCRMGVISKQIAEKLREKNIKAYSIVGGYLKWLANNYKDDEENVSVALKAEDSLRKKFHREILTKFCKAINDYKLILPNDKIAVCISGGKDSMCMAKLFQEVKKHNKIPFEVVYLIMDPGYSKENRELVLNNAKKLNVPVTVFETDIFENVEHITNSPCYVCARMRRGHLYNKAKQLGCNKIALGHHYDDVIETILMGMLYGAQVQTMMPKLHSNNFEGMELIRPMYLIREKDIIRWRDYNNLRFIQCACKMTRTCSEYGDLGSKRLKTKNLIKKLSLEEHQIEGNIFRSVENINLSTIISYKDKEGLTHSFLDDYESGVINSMKDKK
ncbi:MAG: ATPase [Clostridia bacterium]|nr:ATPase [Clostridia bacterium]